MGKFIVIEGLDGAGKSTQIRLLLESLEQQNIKTKFVHFPRTEEVGIYGDLIAKFLRGEFGKLDDVHPQLVALVFALDRFDFAPQIRQWQDEGYMVVVDRYVFSNIAFQCAKLKTQAEKEALSNWIYEYEFGHNQLPKPDVSLYLDVPFSFVKKSLTENRDGESREYLQGKADIHEASITFQESVRNEYEAIVKRYDSLEKVICGDENGNMLDAKMVHQQILNKMNELMG